MNGRVEDLKEYCVVVAGVGVSGPHGFENGLHVTVMGIKAETEEQAGQRPFEIYDSEKGVMTGYAITDIRRVWVLPTNKYLAICRELESRDQSFPMRVDNEERFEQVKQELEALLEQIEGREGSLRIS